MIRSDREVNEGSFGKPFRSILICSAAEEIEIVLFNYVREDVEILFEFLFENFDSIAFDEDAKDFLNGQFLKYWPYKAKKMMQMRSDGLL